MQRLFLVAAISVMAPSAHALSFFNFESLARGWHTSVSETSNGVTATTFQAGGQQFEIVSEPFPASWGSRSLLPNWNTANPMVTNFSIGQTCVRLEAGDWGSDADQISLRGWSGLNGTGTLLGIDIVSYPANLDIGLGDIAELEVRWNMFTPIRSVTFAGIGLGGYQNVFFDNMVTCPVPEPGTMAALGLGIAAIGVRRRRK